MLSMKTLRVAIVTMGSALLLGPGLAMAQNDVRIQLDEVGHDDANVPLVYAQETLPTLADAVTGRRALSLPGAVHLTVKPRRAINASEEVYLRIDLTGAYFAVDPTVAQGSVLDTADPPAPTAGVLGTTVEALESSGGMGSNFWVAKLGTAANGVDIGTGNLLGVVLPSAGVTGGENDLSMAITSGAVTATITSYKDPDDAFDQLGATSTFGGSATILVLQSGLAVTIKAADNTGDNAVASVDDGFLWFVGPTGQAMLGWLGVEEKIGAGVRGANNGLVLAGTEILRTGAQVGFNLMGNLDIGAFSIKEETFEMELTPATDDAADAMQLVMRNGAPVPTGSCDPAVEDAVDQGDLVDEDGMPLISEDGELPSGVDAANFGNQDPDVYLLCVNVDVNGPGTNMNPIPEGDYSATAYIRATATAPAQMVGEEGDLVSIDRNGASVDIAYLTTSEKHNQRLIIVNRGSRDVAITSIQFTTEAGTDVELMDTVQAAMDAGLLVVPAMSSWVARMDETIEITGGSRRVAASLGFAATPGALSVATTQVNVSDGSTDTVVYTVDD